ncbi:MAG: hypothetical protein M1822_008389 [Bathelium mastoideum]|nr:MAG: hypothetical protein M1822_008389 [Bathelium mastoideum]
MGGVVSVRRVALRKAVKCKQSRIWGYMLGRRWPVRACVEGEKSVANQRGGRITKDILTHGRGAFGFYQRPSKAGVPAVPPVMLAAGDCGSSVLLICSTPALASSDRLLRGAPLGPNGRVERSPATPCSGFSRLSIWGR